MANALQQLAEAKRRKSYGVRCGGQCGRVIPITRALMKQAVKAYCGHCATRLRDAAKAKR